ncbi:copper resistance D family protein [Methylococcus capsulatus]|uniref:copper resistance D family protein n=1 Tax=Methylococcus capsulatus TaxID=414 RepID=UPI002FD8DFD0
MFIQGLANFIDDFLGGLMLISYALIVGSLIWAAWILRIWDRAGGDDGAPEPVVAVCVRLLKGGAITLAAMQGTKLLIKGVLLAATLGDFPLEAYFGTVQFIAGLLRFFLSCGFIYVAGRLSVSPADRSAWNTAAILTVPLVISGAWLVHGVGRFEHRERLMILTVIHQLAAAVWVGGVAQLLFLWHSRRSERVAHQFWPRAITRFGWLGAASVLLLVSTGLPLAVEYIGSLDGLFGTGYGSLVATKVALMAGALYFAYRNHKAGKEWKERGASADLTGKVPYFIEAETFVLVGVLFVAATLSSQPPSVDIKDTTATVSEVAYMFSPRLPKISSPTHEQLLAGEPGRVAVVDKVPSVAATEWSDYNHNISGIFLTGMCLVAMLSYTGRFRWTHYWPVGFIGLSIFLFFRSDAETWPLGPIGFWESTFGNGEVFQHRIATLLAFMLGVLELRARTRPDAHRLRYMFPVLSAFGGILLLTHSHAEFELKSEYLIQSTHTAMGLLAVVVASGRWLELRLAAAPVVSSQSASSRFDTGQVAGFLSILAMFVIGNFLMFYREPLY